MAEESSYGVGDTTPLIPLSDNEPAAVSVPPYQSGRGNKKQGPNPETPPTPQPEDGNNQNGQGGNKDSNSKDRTDRTGTILFFVLFGALCITVLISVNITVAVVSSTDKFKCLMATISIIKYLFLCGVLLLSLRWLFYLYSNKDTDVACWKKEQWIALGSFFAWWIACERGRGTRERSGFHKFFIVLFMFGAVVYFLTTAAYHFHCDEETYEIYTDVEGMAAILGCLLAIFITVCIVLTKVDSELFSNRTPNHVIESDSNPISCGGLKAFLKAFPKAVKACIIALVRYLNSKAVAIGLVGLFVAVLGAVAWVDGVTMSNKYLSSSDSDSTSCRKVQLVKYYFYPSVVQFAFLVLVFLQKLLESNGKSHSDGKSYTDQDKKSWMVLSVIVSLLGCAVLMVYLSFEIWIIVDVGHSTAETDLESTSVPKSIWCHLGAQIALLIISLCSCIVCFCFICKSHDGVEEASKDSGDQRNAENSPVLDDLLIIVTAAVITAHCTLDLAADFSCLSLKDCYKEKGKDEHVYLGFEICQLVLNILQPIFQSGILLRMKKMTLETKDGEMSWKESLEVSLRLLFVANMMWVFDLWLFDVQKIRWNKVFLAERSVYDKKPWLIISNFYYPLVIFFRVHSSLVLIQLIFKLRGVTQQRGSTE